METVDPLLSLSSNKLAERAAACRDLSKVGTLDVVPRLASLAERDPSPAVRLTSSSAAADILSRHRVDPRASAHSLDQRREILALIQGIDPGVNAGLFSIFGALCLPESFHQISVGLRDPRGAVRVGAAVGLMRLCMSAETCGDGDLEARVVALLKDKRLKPDAVAEVGRVCAAVGYRSAAPGLADLALTGVFGEAVSGSLDVLAAAAAPLSGAWVSDGRDAGEVSAEPALPATLWVFAGSVAVEATDQGWVKHEIAAGASRRMYIRRVGQPDAEPAIQANGRTFYAARDSELLDAIDLAARWESIDGLHLPTADGAPEADRVASGSLVAGLVESGPALRAAGLLLARAGDRDAAFTALEAATLAKRAPADTWFLLGELALALGRMEEATRAWEAYLKKEKRKRVPLVERASARLGLAASS